MNTIVYKDLRIIHFVIDGYCFTSSGNGNRTAYAYTVYDTYIVCQHYHSETISEVTWKDKVLLDNEMISFVVENNITIKIVGLTIMVAQLCWSYVTQLPHDMPPNSKTDDSNIQIFRFHIAMNKNTCSVFTYLLTSWGSTCNNNNHHVSLRCCDLWSHPITVQKEKPRFCLRS